MKRSGNAGNVLVVVAGPLYVDMQSLPTRPPAPHYHTEIRPRAGDWGAQRRVGGAAWKLARSWARSYGSAGDRVVLVSPVPMPIPDIPDEWRNTHAFVDDGGWLRTQVLEQSAEIAALQLQLIAAEPGTVDYAYHLEDPDAPLWPIMSVMGGAAHNLTWQQVVRVWNTLQSSRAQDRYDHCVIFLTGVPRTQLISTLAAALEGTDELASTTQELLERSRLCIEFGRTDPRTEDKELCGRIRTCVRHAHTVLVDATTARAFDLLEVQHLPKAHLVVRPQGVLPGQWWLMRRADPAQGMAPYVERRVFEAPAPKPQKPETGPPQGETYVDRPSRVGTLVRRLCLGEKLDGQRPWERYPDLSYPRCVEDMTLSPQLRETLWEIEKQVRSYPDGPLLIFGDTGTGKGVVARYLHAMHPKRCHGPFLEVGGGYLYHDVVDSTLFGHKRGAFTGAHADRVGRFVAADGGFLVLNDLHNLPIATQNKLLDVIEERKIWPLGYDAPTTVDVFLVVTTNVHPHILIKEGKLKEELYFRLCRKLYLQLPPLRERREDVVRFARWIWEDCDMRDGACVFPAGLDRALRCSPLNGNFRMLESVVRSIHMAAMHAQRHSSVPPGGICLPPDAAQELGVSETGDPILPVSSETPPAPAEPVRRQRDFPLLKKLEDSGRAATICDGNLQTRFHRFFGAWAELADECGASELSKADILQITGADKPGDARAVWRYLNELAKSERLPRVRPTGTGRAARWQLVR